jgi:uncharacterized membrane protein (DUF106 family)
MTGGLEDFMMGLLLANTVGIIFVIVGSVTSNSKLKKMQERMSFIYQRAQRAKRAEEAREDQELKRLEALKKRKHN